MRGTNCTRYKWHVVGKLYDRHIDKKYCSLTQFLDENKELGLDRYKLRRIRNGQDTDWFNADIKKIDEKRKFRRVYVD